MSGGIIICLTWEERRPGSEKARCADCGCDVSIFTSNLPRVRAERLKILCSICGAASMAAGVFANDPPIIRGEMRGGVCFPDSPMANSGRAFVAAIKKMVRDNDA